MRIHRFSELFPPVVGKAYSKLARDLRRDGKVPSVTLFEGALLDGRARKHIAETNKLQCNTVDYAGNDPIGFLIKQNLPRCWSLPMSQRAMIAAKAMSLIEDPTTRTDLIGDLRVPPSMLAGARRILASATPSEIKAVSEGRTSISVLQAKVRARSPLPPGPKPRPKPQGPSPAAAHVLNLRARALLWRRLRDGLDQLLVLPPPPDVAAAMVKIPNIGLERRLEKARHWLENFSAEWRKQNNG